MKGTRRVAAIRNLSTALFATLFLGGCLSSEGESPAAFVPEHSLDIIVAGSVGDGPAANADIRITARDGRVLAELQSDSNGLYAVTISTRGAYYPLRIRATGGTDLVTGRAPDFTMRSAVLESGDSAVANINPHSTLAFELARDLNGGISRDNLRKAQSIVVESMNSGLTSFTASGTIATPVDTGNVSEIVKSSETLAEIVRRTRNALTAAGHTVDGDKVMERLGSDLIDRVIEGHGGPRADERTAAVATIVAAQVMLESMANSLHVNGSNATAAMRLAIEQVSPGQPNPKLDDLTVTADMIAMAEVGLAAAAAVSNDPGIGALRQALNGVQPGTTPAFVQSMLPPNYRNMLNEALALTASGDAAVLDAVNEVARSGPPDQPPPGNRAPTISGAPATTVVAGKAYEFMPTSSDLDRDTLTYRISGKPDWASFDDSNGRLFGTPGDDDVGTHSGITITVDDGQETDSVGPFSITVEPTPPVKVSITLDWTPPTKNDDGSDLNDDLAAYKIYWGTSSGRYPNSVRVDAPGISSYVVENLDPGTYHFVATAINKAGVESDYSNEIIRTATAP